MSEYDRIATDTDVNGEDGKDSGQGKYNCNHFELKDVSIF